MEVFKTLGFDDDTVVKRMFETWDKDGDGNVDFSELLNAIAVTAGGSADDKMSLCFRSVDLNGDGAW